jgi:hypothetical protein
MTRVPSHRRQSTRVWPAKPEDRKRAGRSWRAGRSSRVAVVLALGGCAQLAGLDETSGDGRIPVSLGFERVSVGVTVERAPLDLGDLPATYLVIDPAEPGGLRRIAAEPAGDTWTAELFEPAPVVFELPELTPIPRMFDLPARTLLGGFAQLERPDAAPVAPEAVLSVTLTLDVPYGGEGLQLFTVGSWNVRGLEPPPIGEVVHAVPPFQVQTMASLSGRPHDRITTADAVYVLRHAGATLNGIGEVAPFDQTGDDVLSAQVTTIALDRTLDVAIDPSAAALRFTAARPAVPALGFSWTLRAAPGHEVAIDQGPQLAAAGVGLEETTIAASYGNPFEARGWRGVLLWSATASRTFVPAGQSAGVTLSAGLFQRELDPAAGVVLDLPAGLPELIRLDGRSLSIDGAVTIARPDRPLEVTVVTDRDSATLHELEVHELVPSADGTAILRTRTFVATTLEPRFLLPPELFEPGKAYTLRAIAIAGGFPNAADGDLRARALPIAVGFLDSGVFEVAP